jgi:orotate phosphoribosyltransferase
MQRNDLARRIFETAHLTGEFRLRSGTISKEYFDKYQFESDPALLRAIAEHMAERLPADAELLAGLEMGGIPLATMLAQVTGLPALFVRKQAKQYGTAKLAEGPPIEGKRLVIVEDVVTSGGQAVISTGDLRERGARVSHALCVIDREAGGGDALAELDVELRPLCRMSELKAAGGA